MCTLHAVVTHSPLELSLPTLHILDRPICTWKSAVACQCHNTTRYITHNTIPKLYCVVKLFTTQYNTALVLCCVVKLFTTQHNTTLVLCCVVSVVSDVSCCVMALTSHHRNQSTLQHLHHQSNVLKKGSAILDQARYPQKFNPTGIFEEKSVNTFFYSIFQR